MWLSEIAAWAGGPTYPNIKRVETKEASRPNPKYTGPNSNEPVNISVKVVTWVRNDGQTLSVEDDGHLDKGPKDPSTESGYKNDIDLPVYGSGDDKTDDTKDTRSPEEKDKQEAQHAEAAWNRDNGPASLQPGAVHGPLFDGSGRGSGIYEAHADRIQRERAATNDTKADEDRASRNRIEEQNQQNRGKELEVSQAQAEEAARHNKASEAATTAQTAISQSQADVAAAREAREGRTPQVVGTPQDDNENIIYIDPATGEIKSGTNPIYNQKKTEAAQKQKELALAIQAGTFTREEAAQQYKEWYDKNINTPLLLAQERRAQAAEQRAALDAEEKRKQFASDNELKRAQLGQNAAESAQANVRAELPMMVGKNFGKDYSDAINGLAHGGTLGTNAASGIHFSASDFQFNAPDWKKISRNATSDALKHLTPYQPTDTPYQAADYSGLAIPTPDTIQGAPSYTPSIDVWSQIGAALPSYVPPGTIPSTP